MSGRFVVYALSDPRDGLVRYIGRTSNLSVRTAAHKMPHNGYGLRSTEHQLLVRELRAAGLDGLGIRVLQRTRTKEASKRAEKKWIGAGVALGLQLLNRNTGDGRRIEKKHRK